MIGYEQALAVCQTDPEAAARMFCEFARELSPVEGGGRHAESRERRPAPRLPIPVRQGPGAGGSSYNLCDNSTDQNMRETDMTP